MPVLTKINTNVIADDAVTAAKIPADAVLASEIATGAVSFAELDTATGIESTHHKVPTFATNSARDTAIPSPAVGMIIYNTASGALEQYNGAWAAIVPAPVILSISGFLNEDNDSTLTIIGSSFNSASIVKMFSAASGGSQVGSNATTTFNSASKLTAVFGSGSLGSAGDTVYIEVDNSGVASRFPTAITLNADPVVALSGNSGTGADATDHLGTYGGAVAGGGADNKTVLLLNFDRTNNSQDFESHDNTAGLWTGTDKQSPRITMSGAPTIKTTVGAFNGVNSGKVNNSALYLDGDEWLIIADSADWDFGGGSGGGDYTVDHWARLDHSPSGMETFWSFNNAGSNADTLFFRVNSSTELRFYMNEGGTAVNFPITYTVVANVWTHYAIVRYNGTIKCYVDGVEKSMGAASANVAHDAVNHIKIGARATGDQRFTGYIDSLRISKGIARWTAAFPDDLPTKIYGSTESSTIPTITLTGTTTPTLAADEDIEYTSVANTTKPANNQHLTDSGIGLVLTNLTGGDKSKATFTGTIASGGGTTHTNMPVKAQVRKTLGDAAYANAERTVTFSGSTTTIGLAPAMPVSGTGIPAATTITTVDSSTQITLSANPTGGTLTGQSLVFLDPNRLTHINGSDTLNNANAMMSIATGAGEAHKLFNARTTMGTGAARAVTGFGFTPDLVWIKGRDMSDVGRIMDTLRTLPSFLTPSTTSAISTSTDLMTSMDTDGYTLKTSAGVNQNNIRFIAWAWKAGGTPSANGKRKTDGSGTETTFAAAASPSTSLQYTTGIQYVKQSVNSIGDFSITRYQAPSSTESAATYKLPHGLSGQPDFFTIKGFNSSRGWQTWHQNFADLSQSHIFINTNAAVVTSTAAWADTDPDATHISLKHNGPSLYNGEEYMMYAWKAVAGVSSFGTYAGGTYNTNTSACGFKPRYLMIKQTNGTGQWNITDEFRGYTAYTGTGNYLYGDSGSNEDANGGYGVEFVTNGFHLGTSDTINGSGHTYIYIAFA